MQYSPSSIERKRYITNSNTELLMLAGRVRSGIPRLNDNHKLEACLLSCLLLQRCKKTPIILRYLQLNIRVLKYAMYINWLTLLAVSAASFFQAPAAPPPLYLVTESVWTINTKQNTWCEITCNDKIKYLCSRTIHILTLGILMIFKQCLWSSVTALHYVVVTTIWMLQAQLSIKTWPRFTFQQNMV